MKKIYLSKSEIFGILMKNELFINFINDLLTNKVHLKYVKNDKGEDVIQFKCKNDDSFDYDIFDDQMRTLF